MKIFIRILIAVVLLYVLAGAFLYTYQRSFMYYPRPRYSSLSEIGLKGTTEEALTTADGVRIIAWYSPAPQGATTVVFFHGNGGYIAAFAERVVRAQAKGYGMMLVEYRGYSGLKGAPTEEGLYADGRAALDWLAAHDVPSSGVFLYGESLGSGVAVKLATERRVGGVILESPYTSAAAVGEKRFWLFPVRWLITDRFDSLARIKDIHAPLLIMHGGNDGVIPQEQGRELFAAALEPKVGYFPADAHHVDLLNYGGADQIDAFIAKFRQR
jgi:fermentation-respiration switch protein FrsA (DUF1100 family)